MIQRIVLDKVLNLKLSVLDRVLWRLFSLRHFFIESFKFTGFDAYLLASIWLLIFDSRLMTPFLILKLPMLILGESGCTKITARLPGARQAPVRPVSLVVVCVHRYVRHLV